MRSVPQYTKAFTSYLNFQNKLGLFYCLMCICNNKCQQATINVTPLYEQATLKKQQNLTWKASLVLQLHTTYCMCNNKKKKKSDYL